MTSMIRRFQKNPATTSPSDAVPQAEGAASTMRLGSLFAGIGGFDLAARWMGWETAWFSEIDPYCSAVLAKHWSGVPNHGDVDRIDWRTVEPVDLVCGGFPCQPVSRAGKREAQADERWLWPAFARCISALRPRYALMENVPGLLDRGMGDILGDLARMRYDAEWCVIPATAASAPHRRERVWVLAYPVGVGGQPGILDRGELAAAWREARMGQFGGMDGPEAWLQAIPRLCGSNDGVPSVVDRLRCCGNSIVPQVAQMVFQAIEAAEEHMRNVA